MGNTCCECHREIGPNMKAINFDIDLSNLGKLDQASAKLQDCTSKIIQLK